jgi:hypothetical protein
MNETIKLMKFVRPYRLVILIVLPVVVLVLIRAYAPGSFKPDAARQAEASLTGANVLDQLQVAALGSKPLIVKLVTEDAARLTGSPDTLVVKAVLLLEKKYLNIIHGHHGPVILVSDDPSVSAKAWMILSQIGYHDLFVLREKESTEVLKYKFRPDSAAGI